jgi:hypothetical protein
MKAKPFFTAALFAGLALLLFAACDNPATTPPDEQPEPLIQSANIAEKFGAEKFGISLTDDADVADLFDALHQYLAAQTDPADIENDFAVGDYLDLPHLTIGGTGIGRQNRRLIVVGINSFNGVNANGAVPHLVLQFQNAPVTSYLTSSPYGGSGLQLFLLGDFTQALVAGGVPLLDTSRIWRPARKVWRAHDNDLETITDALWLPTEWEIYGENIKSMSNGAENGANQARLSYYNSPDRQAKYASGGYRVASDLSGVDEYHLPRYIAPAFCVR